VTSIEVRGARENNLKDVSLDIPEGRITVFTGVSGSGKSSLVFGTIAAESQRLLNETHTAFVQNFLPSIPQPDVDALRNLSAAIVVGRSGWAATAARPSGPPRTCRRCCGCCSAGSGSRRCPTRRSCPSPRRGHVPALRGRRPDRRHRRRRAARLGQEPERGPIKLADYAVGKWYWEIFASSGFFDLDKKLRDYSPRSSSSSCAARPPRSRPRP
jgi:energy-coupling factor transporter ATP-binding protein EcfA2